MTLATKTRLDVRPLTKYIGAEIRGVDMRRPMDRATRDAVHDAWMKHLVVVFPDQRVTDQEHVAFTRHFGEPEIFHQTSLALRSDRVKEIFLVSNVDENDRLLPPSDRGQKQLSSSRQWHTDSSYRAMPSVGSLLHGIEISRTGGITQFINMYMVYDELPDALRRQVEGRKARHDFAMLSRLTGAPAPSGAERAAVPPVWHPMVRRHPVTGRKCLFVNESFTRAIIGMDEAQSAPLLALLFAHLKDPRFIYRHRWCVGDVLTWDNCATQHIATFDYGTRRRLMHRVGITGGVPV